VISQLKPKMHLSEKVITKLNLVAISISLAISIFLIFSITLATNYPSSPTAQNTTEVSTGTTRILH